MKDLIILKWDSFVLSLVSILYGIWLLSFPQILSGYRVYDLVDETFNNHFIGMVFIFLGFLKFVGVWLNNRFVKRLSLISLAALWAVFAVSFVLSPPPNTVWIFSLGMAALAFGIALKEG